MSVSGKVVPVEKVAAFMDEIVTDCEEVVTRLIVLKTRIAKRSIGDESIMRELDEILTIIRR